MHTELDLYFYATVLETMPSLGMDRFTKEDIERVYSCLEVRAVGEEEGEFWYGSHLHFNSPKLTTIVNSFTRVTTCAIMKRDLGYHSLSADGK